MINQKNKKMLTKTRKFYNKKKKKTENRMRAH